MARQANYEQKIETLKAKIATKSEQIKKLKDQLTVLEKEAAKSVMEDVIAYVNDNKLDPADVLKVLKDHYKK